MAAGSTLPVLGGLGSLARPVVCPWHRYVDGVSPPGDRVGCVAVSAERSGRVRRFARRARLTQP